MDASKALTSGAPFCSLFEIMRKSHITRSPNDPEATGVPDLLERCRRLMAEQDKLADAFENESALLPSSSEISAAIARELESAIGWVTYSLLAAQSNRLAS
jgi:hypothetical protein